MHKIPCNVCGEKREFDEIHKDRASGLRVVRCRGCGLIFVNPTFTPHEHLEYYSSIHWSEFPTAGTGSYSFIPPEQVEHWEKRAKAHIDYLATFYAPVKEGRRIHVLEVGCGYAAHLEELKRRCPEASLAAVEPNRRIYAIIRKRMPKTQILGKTIETLGGGRMLFDCIIAVDVLERTVDPTTALRRIHTMLGHDGRCLIVTHNAAGRSGSVYDLSQLYYFTEGTLAPLFRKCRLDLVRQDIRGETGLAGDDRIYNILSKK